MAQRTPLPENYRRIARSTLFLLLFAFLGVLPVNGRQRSRPRLRAHGPTSIKPHYWTDTPPISLCKEHYRNSTLDHFAWDPPEGRSTFMQRYFLCSIYWKEDDDGQMGPIFVYLGNEADVTLYVNETGLMWENADSYGALLVFVEHRYYGKSKPPGYKKSKLKQYLTTEQALADYAEFITELKTNLNATDSPVIGFGGSYGGMLAAWFRMKYPHIVDGVIAASAPIWSFLGEDPPYDPNGFYKIVTFAASSAAGCSESCIPNIRKAWTTIQEIGLDVAKKAMGICDATKVKSVWDLIYWASDAFVTFAEGSYPFPSDYLTNGYGVLPAYPMRMACNTYLREPLDGTNLLAGISQAAGLLYNSTGELDCFDINAGVDNATEEDGDLWDCQYCTEMFQPFGSDGVQDMFWYAPYDEVAEINWCLSYIGTMPRPLWATVQWGGKKISTASNIVFSNGQYDPWRSGGVTSQVSDSVVAFTIAEAGHHVDLMFSHPQDTDAIKAARAVELEAISMWINQGRDKRRHRPMDHHTELLKSEASTEGSNQQNLYVVT